MIFEKLTYLLGFTKNDIKLFIITLHYTFKNNDL